VTLDRIAGGVSVQRSRFRSLPWHLRDTLSANRHHRKGARKNTLCADSVAMAVTIFQFS